MEHNAVLLFDVLERTIDNRGRTPPISEVGYPLVEIKHIQSGRLYPVFDDTKFVDQTTWDTWFRGHLKQGDILFSTVGSIARSCIVPDEPKFCIAQNVLAFRVDNSKADPRYIYYAINGGFFLHEVHGRTIETVQKSIKVYDLKTARIPLPPPVEQHAIAQILGTLDDKIELNRRMNETLEAMAQALFKSWFLDVTQDGLPEGWREGILGDVAENPRRTIAPNEIDPKTPYIGLEHMPRRSIALSEWGHAKELESNKFLFGCGEILFGKLRPYFHKVGVAPMAGVCSTDILVVRPKEKEWFGFILGHISSVDLVNHTNAASTGTKMPRTNWQDIARFEVALPPRSLAAAFTKTIRPLIDRIIANIYESRTLAELRDALLPKLLSGEIKLSEHL